jgi:integrase
MRSATIEEALEGYTQYLKQNRKPNTIKAELQILKWFLLFAEINKKRFIEDITYRDVLVYIDTAKTHPEWWSENYLVQWSFTFRKFFTICKKMGFIDWDVSLIQVSHKIRKKPKVATTEEIRGLMKYFQSTRQAQRNLLILRLLVETGIRRQELCEIEIKDVFWAENKILIHNSKAKVEPIDYVFVSDAVMESIKSYVGTRSEGRLFLTKQGKPITTNTVERLFERASAEACARNIGTHSIRHWFGRNLANHHASYREIMEALRHTDPRSAVIYTGADEKRKRNIFDKYRIHLKI